MASFLKPRRGIKSTAETQLIDNHVLRRGEIFFEVPDTGVGTGIGKIKMGDGETAYADLPYFVEDYAEIIGDTDISSIGDGTLTGAVSSLNNDLVASDNLKFKFGKDSSGKYGYYDSNNNLVPFKNPTGNKSITIDSVGTTSGIDVSDYATASVTTSGLSKPSGEISKSYTSNGTRSFDVSDYSTCSVSVSVSGQSGYISTYATLWTNSSPTSQFRNQTITWSGYSLTSYTGSRYYIRVNWRLSTSDSTSSSVLMRVSDFVNTASNAGTGVALAICRKDSTGTSARRFCYEDPNSIYITSSQAMNASGTGYGSNIPTSIELVAIYPS